MEQKQRDEDGEDGVAVVEGVGEDAVDAQHGEWRGQQEGDWPRDDDAGAQDVEGDAPGEHGGEGSGSSGVEDLVEVDAAGEAEDGSLQQKCQRWVDEGEVAIGMLAERHAGAAIEQVAEVPDDGEAGVLPEHERGGGKKEQRGREYVASRPAGCR